MKEIVLPLDTPDYAIRLWHEAGYEIIYCPDTSWHSMQILLPPRITR